MYYELLTTSGCHGLSCFITAFDLELYWYIRWYFDIIRWNRLQLWPYHLKLQV